MTERDRLMAEAERNVRMTKEAGEREGAFCTIYSMCMDLLIEHDEDEMLYGLFKESMDIFRNFMLKAYPNSERMLPKVPEWKPSWKVKETVARPPTATEAPKEARETTNKLEADLGPEKTKALRDTYMSVLIAGIAGTMAGVKTKAGAKRAAEMAQECAALTSARLFGIHFTDDKERAKVRSRK